MPAVSVNPANSGAIEATPSPPVKILGTTAVSNPVMPAVGAIVPAASAIKASVASVVAASVPAEVNRAGIKSVKASSILGP